MHIFVVENLSKAFGSFYALKDINFQVEKGEIFGILGPSGSGKTTLLRLLNLLDKPSSGRILFNGVDVRKVPEIKIRRRMSLVFQNPIAFSSTVYENVAYGLKIRGTPEGEIRRRVKRALEIVKLSGYEGRDAKTLSGGELQRMAIARAIVLNPEVLLLDEPTSNMDPINEKVIEELIVEINRKLNVTIILATHKQGEAIRLCDHILVLNSGKVEQIGTPEDVFYRPKSVFVANFVRTENIFKGEVLAADDTKLKVRTEGFVIQIPVSAERLRASKGDEVHFCIRPEDVMLLRDDVELDPAIHTNIVEGLIAKISPREAGLLRLNVELIGSDCRIAVEVPRHVSEKMSLHIGKRIRLSLKESAIHLITG